MGDDFTESLYMKKVQALTATALAKKIIRDNKIAEEDNKTAKMIRDLDERIAKETAERKALQVEKKRKRAKETADWKALLEEKKRKRTEDKSEQKVQRQEEKKRKKQEKKSEKLKESVRVNSICVSCQCLSLYFCYNLTFIC